MGKAAGSSTVGAGVNLVSTTGNAVGTVFHDGVNLVTGQSASHQNVKMYKKNGVIMRHGHQYKIHNGHYVLVR